MAFSLARTLRTASAICAILNGLLSSAAGSSGLMVPRPVARSRAYYDRQCGTDAQDFPGKLYPGQVGHGVVGYKNVELVRSCRKRSSAFRLSVSAVTAYPSRVRIRKPDRAPAVRHPQRAALFPCPSGCSARHCPTRPPAILLFWEERRKRWRLCRVRCLRLPLLMTLYDSVNDCQPQPAPFAYFLGRKIGIENPLDRSGIHPRAGIRDVEPQVRAGLQIRAR